jgi:hypothetical protein
VPQLTTAQEGAAALLIQVKADSQEGLHKTIKKAQGVLSGSGASFGGQADKPLGVESYPFSTDPRVSLLKPVGSTSCCVSSCDSCLIAALQALSSCQGL